MAFGKKYSLIAILGIALVSGSAWWYQKKATNVPGQNAPANGPTAGSAAGSSAAPTPGGARMASVEVAKVETMALQDDASAIGTLKSQQNVMMRPEVAGRVAALGFSDGARVRAGQVLVQLDDTLQRAEVKQSLAQVSIAEANLKRNQELVAQNFVSQRVLDESAANLQVVQAQLALSCARLGRMAVVAPFDGMVGLRVVNKGDYVKDGADLVNLEDISTMLVDFRLPERLAGKVKLGQSVALQLDAFPSRQFKASIVAIDPLLEPNGRSIGLRASLPNTSGEPAAVNARAGGAGGAGAPKGAPSGNASPGIANATAKASGPGLTVKTPTPARSKPAPGPVAEMTLPSLQASLAQAGCPSDSGGSLRGGLARNGAPVPKVAASKTSGKPAATGTSQTRGVPAPLRPGMFARVNTIFSVRESALVVPEEAVVPQGARLFVIRVVKASELPPAAQAPASGSVPAVSGAPVTSPGPLPAADDLVALRQEVKLGIRRQGKVEVTEGLQLGQIIVVAGQQRLQRDGSPVRVVASGRPAGGPAAAASGNMPATASAPAASSSR
jgi:multidrug efflux pump subunit AcrA (membrane-fusion protein)